MLSVQYLMEHMTLREKIAQLFLQYFQGYEDMPQRLIAMNQKSEVGGFIFFSGNNVKDIDQLHRMTEKIQSHHTENRFQIPFLLSIDQEGGQLAAIFRGNTLFPGNMSLGLANDKNLAQRQGVHVGKELSYAGIDLCFAPVLDVDYDVVNQVSIVDNRRYSHLPEVVSDMGGAYIQGLQEQGIIACGKHFPGMRITEVDTHFAVDRSPYDRERLESVEILPFKNAIASGLHGIMTHHGIFESFDPDYPASLSKKVITYLRDELHFGGLVITDDLIMQAILKEYGEKEPIKLALNAGSDLIISTCASDWFVDYVEACVLNNEISLETIDRACERVLSYKASHNVGNVTPEKTYSDKEGHDLAVEIARKALVLYKGDKTDLPVPLKDTEKLGILFGNPARLVMSDATNLYDISLKDIFIRNGFATIVKEAIMPWNPTHEEIISLADVGIISDIILFTTVNAYRFDKQIDVLKEIRKYCPNKKIIAVASRSPQDAPYLAEYADIVVITGGITENTFTALGNCLFGDGHFVDHPMISYLDQR